MEKDKKPNPDELLAQINIDEAQNKKGKLKLYIGMCAGVGKTFSMLQDANKAIGKGIDALIGYVETHKRSETEFLLFYDFKIHCIQAILYTLIFYSCVF